MKKLSLLLIFSLLPVLLITPPTLAEEPLACEYIYTVQAGDWLSKIAEKYLDDPLAYEAIIKAANAQADDAFTNIDSPDMIEPGWVLCIDTAQLAAEGLLVEVLANTTYKSEWTQSGTATLVDGEYREPAAPGSATETVVKLTDHVAYGQLNGQPAAAAVLVTDPGGSGTFYDLALVVNQNGQPVNVATTGLGDRVIIHAVSIIDNEIVVDMVQAGPDDPMCCPTQWVVNRYVLQNDQLEQTSSEQIETITDKGGLTPEPVIFDPNGLASYVKGGIVPAEPYDSSLPPDLAGYPDHVVFLFDDEVRLAIYPIAEYQAIWDAVGDSRVTAQVNALKQLLAERESRPEVPSPPLPMLPPPEGVNDLAVQFNYIDFTGGSGVRYVGRTVSENAPVTNDQLNYYFQGLTADGKYYVSFIFPVWAADWPDTVDDVSAEDRQQVASDYEAYLAQTADTLAQLNADTAWLPPLSMLDGMVQSITINQ
jgi:hypothetical protein